MLHLNRSLHHWVWGCLQGVTGDVFRGSQTRVHKSTASTRQYTKWAKIHNMKVNNMFNDVWYSKAQIMLKVTFNVLIIIRFRISSMVKAPKHCCPTMYHTATVRPTRSGPSILWYIFIITQKTCLTIWEQFK